MFFFYFIHIALPIEIIHLVCILSIISILYHAMIRITGNRSDKLGFNDMIRMYKLRVYNTFLPIKLRRLIMNAI